MVSDSRQKEPKPVDYERARVYKLETILRRLAAAACPECRKKLEDLLAKN